MFDRLIDEDPDDLPLYVFQDEGHHCRRRGEQITSGELSADEYDEEGQWYSALLLLRQERNLQAVIDFFRYSSVPSETKSTSHGTVSMVCE